MDSFALLKLWRRTAPSHHIATCNGSDPPEDDDNGPFFDLEFEVFNHDEIKSLYPVEGDHQGEENGNGDTDSGCMDHECASNDDPIFFKGDLLPILPSTNDTTTPKTTHFPVSLMNSSAWLKNLMSGLKKPVSLHEENPGNGKPESEVRQNIRRRLFIKFRVEEKPLVSLFYRDNTNQSQAKPVRAGFREVCQQLGKSRSSSSSVTAVQGAPTVASRMDDSLLQQQDGIQGAILHCKRSFNESRDFGSGRVSDKGIEVN